MNSMRSDVHTYEQTEFFCDVFEDIVAQYAAKNIPVNPETLCNMDETLLRIVSHERLEVELVPHGELTGTPSVNDPTIVGSMLAFITANGVVPFVYFCMKKEGRAKKYPVPIIATCQNEQNSNMTTVLKCTDSWSETGYVSENHIEDAITQFAGVMKEHWGHLKSPIILLADNLRQH